MKQVIVTVDKEGKTEIETKGFVGSECRIATGNLERLLGNVTSDKPTQEMHDANANRTRSKS